MNPKILVIELWGLGDAVIMSAFLRSLPAEEHQVTVLCKPASAALLRPSFPTVDFIEFSAPWTAFRGKYRLWSWPWRSLVQLFARLRKAKFDWAVSVRRDPRDALLMWLGGAHIRCGFPRAGGGLFLNLHGNSDPKRHKVEDWWHLAERMFPGKCRHHPPQLMTPDTGNADAPCWSPRDGRPMWVIHCGAGQPIRRWPESYFRELLSKLRQDHDFQLGLILDHDGAGDSLVDIADLHIRPSSIHHLLQSLAEADLLFANDSGPGHIAAALGKPVVSLFGSQNPDWFRPYGEQVQVVKLTPAPSPPRFDSGGEQERRCLVELTPDIALGMVQPFIKQLPTNR